ncbi:MAG: hypothetical protein HY390_07935 [Deltaproteobacteria bacterium]|nr:hypothetical protein [Deltaproteobacteria bacterium]
MNKVFAFSFISFFFFIGVLFGNDPTETVNYPNDLERIWDCRELQFSESTLKVLESSTHIISLNLKNENLDWKEGQLRLFELQLHYAHISMGEHLKKIHHQRIAEKFQALKDDLLTVSTPLERYPDEARDIYLKRSCNLIGQEVEKIMNRLQSLRESICAENADFQNWPSIQKD